MADRPALSTHPDEIARRAEIFIEVYAASGNGEGSAVAAGYTPGRSARKAAEKFLADPELGSRAREARDSFVANQAAEFAAQAARIRRYAADAIESLRDVAMNSKSHMARVTACVALADRAGHKPAEHIVADINDTRSSKEIPDAELERIAFGGGAGAADPASRPN